MEKEKTPFEKALVSIENGKTHLPRVSMEGKTINYIHYQLTIHKFNLGILAKGMKFRNIKFTDIKYYYGLKSNNAKDAYPEFIELMNNYLNDETLKTTKK